MKYVIILYWSEDDEAYIAEVPELSGCMADGPTAAEALHNVELIAQEWIETARELGPSGAGAEGPLEIRVRNSGFDVDP